MHSLVRENTFTARFSLFPGFGLTLGISVLYLSLMVILPLSTIAVVVLSGSFSEFCAAVFSPRALSAYRMTLMGALTAAMINTCLGLLTAWVLVRYEFPGKRIVDALIDLPFALPTAVAGIALTALLASDGLIGGFFASLGIEIAFTPLGVIAALVFVSFPFVVRAVQPVLAALDPTVEEAALTIGAQPSAVFRKVLLPALCPALLSGFSLAFARALGEYGSVVFISGNMPFQTEIVPVLIMSRLERFDLHGASSLALVMLACSLVLLFMINWLQFYFVTRKSGGA